ncbi:MAG: pyridoxal phosphate-dependent aminotransferase [Candidatus Micrarchaeaceae archaeon]
MFGLSKRSKYAVNVIEEQDHIAEKLVRSGKKVIRLNRGDPVAYFPTPKYTIDALVKAVKEGRTGYSYHAGIRELREAISERHKRLYNLDVSEDDILVTQGVSEAILFLNSLLINQGDIGVMLKPFYPLYMSALQINGGIPMTADYADDGTHSLDTDTLRKKLKKSGKRAKYLIFSNPSNPNGAVIERRALKEMAEIANDNDLIVISDEIYDEIGFNGAHFTSLSEVSRGIPTVILGGASKNFNATGLRIGYAIMPEGGKESNEIKRKLPDFAKMRLSSNTPSQYAFAQSIRNAKEHSSGIRKMVKEIESRVNFAHRLINESRYMQSTMPRGAFYLFPKIDFSQLRIKTGKDIATRLLIEEGVQITRGSGFGAPGNIRIVALAPQDILESAIRKIDKFFIRHSK